MNMETRSMQLWPGGASVTIRGDLYDKKGRHLRDGYGHEAGRWRKGTIEDWRKVEIEHLAELYAARDILCCDSSLVDDLIKAAGEMGRSDLADGFGYEEIQNLYADPSDWDLERCREYIHDNGLDEPTEGNVWKMDRADLVELLTNVSIECRDDETDETLREAVIANIDDETIDGLDDWRNVCRDYAQDNPAEVFEWWRVSSWLCDKLKDAGEVVIDNGYGHWWGRTCTGQGLIMDGTLQRIAAQFLRVE